MLLLGEFGFRTVTKEDFALLHRWLNEPHVAEWWDGPVTLAEVFEKYQRKLRESWQQCYIVVCDDQPRGYMGVYRAAEVGNGWWPNAEANTVGIDAFVGDAECVSRGLGARFVGAFTDWLLARPGIEKVITDPSPANFRAVRCFEKAGFRRGGAVTTPDGPALLMEKTEPSTGVGMPKSARA